MPMSSSCPISYETVDERAARLCAFQVLLPLGLSLCFTSAWPALLLAADFTLRGFGARRLSPMARLSQWLARRLGLEARRTNGGPKAFAAKLGLGFSLAVASAFLFGNQAVGVAAGVPFALCAILESIFGFCVGCRIYQVWQRLRSHPEPARVRWP
jgi:hypothetical protein